MILGGAGSLGVPSMSYTSIQLQQQQQMQQPQIPQFVKDKHCNTPTVPILHLPEMRGNVAMSSDIKPVAQLVPGESRDNEPLSTPPPPADFEEGTHYGRPYPEISTKVPDETTADAMPKEDAECPVIAETGEKVKKKRKRKIPMEGEEVTEGTQTKKKRKKKEPVEVTENLPSSSLELEQETVAIQIDSTLTKPKKARKPKEPKEPKEMKSPKEPTSAHKERSPKKIKTPEEIEAARLLKSSKRKKGKKIKLLDGVNEVTSTVETLDPLLGEAAAANQEIVVEEIETPVKEESKIPARPKSKKKRLADGYFNFKINFLY